MSINKQILKEPQNYLAMYHNIIDCGFQGNQTLFKIAIYNAKIWWNRRELLY